MEYRGYKVKETTAGALATLRHCQSCGFFNTGGIGYLKMYIMGKEVTAITETRA